MLKKFLLGLILILALSCNKEDGGASIKQGNGSVWLSGGLEYCAAQIHLDNEDTLIVNIEDIMSFKLGDKVSVKYKEISINEFCAPGIDCEITEIKKVE